MSRSKGGHPVDEFVHKHFTTVGEKTASKRWNMRCNYCPPESQLIVHRDSRCLLHLSKSEAGFCANAPQEVRDEARKRLMLKGGIEIAPDLDSDVEIIGNLISISDSSTSKKAKILGTGEGTFTKRGIDAFLERTMTETEINQANVNMLRFFIHGNIAFSAAENFLLLKWIHGIRPSYI